MAAHAAIVMTAAREQEKSENLELALQNDRRIGIAIGIMMHSQNLAQREAFDFLVNVSQRLNHKLRDVAGVPGAGGVA